METLDQQIEAIISEAPNDGITVSLVRAIAPLLKQTASQLKHPKYHVLQGRDDGWVITTLSNRTQPELEKSVIYAFPTIEDAQAKLSSNQGHEIKVVGIPVIQILFRLIALQRVESAIFFEERGNSKQGTEIPCHDFRTQVQAYLAAYQSQQRSRGASPLPPTIA